MFSVKCSVVVVKGSHFLVLSFVRSNPGNQTCFLTENNRGTTSRMSETTQSEIDFGDLSHDENLKKIVTAFHNSTDDIGAQLQKFCESDQYQNLSPEDRIEYDLLLAYSINALFWMYLHTVGIDPSQHGIKGELVRVQKKSAEAKQVKDRKTMPHVDVDAAKRFIKSGLWQPKTKEDEEGEPKRKHLRFDNVKNEDSESRS